MKMSRWKYYECHRQARIGNLGLLATGMENVHYRWFLHEVYDLRFPHVGDDRHIAREQIARFGRLFGLRAKLVEWHNRHGWWHCGHKPLIRLWVEFKASRKSSRLEPVPKRERFVGRPWRLKSGLLYAGLKGPFALAALVGPDDAQIFDSRDNSDMKTRFYSALLGCKFEVEYLTF